MRGVTTFALRYFGRQVPTDVMSWTEDWSSAINLQALVELRIVNQSGGATSLVPIVIPILSGPAPRMD